MMIIGIDDTDSRTEGGCTTYLAAVLMEKLQEYGTFADYPLLIRLNPNIKYKTRGNGAIALSIEIEDSRLDAAKKIVLDEVADQSKLSDENTNPGVVFLNGASEGMRDDLKSFSRRAIQDILRIEDAKRLINTHKIESHEFKNGRGLIGALAAAGIALNGITDHTFELIAYREPGRASAGMPRDVDAESIREADLQTYPRTWDTVDIANDAIVCVPHGNDPVLFGIRGEIDGVLDVFNCILSEPAERTVIFRTNQGTDMHLMRVGLPIDQVKDGCSYILDGTVCDPPRTIHGGHVIFKIADKSGTTIDCAAFEPTKNFRETVRKLIAGDRVAVCGSVSNETVHLEKIKIEHLAAGYEVTNPVCACGRRMKSAGTRQGYRCKQCGSTASAPDRVPIERDLDAGWYEVPPCARRHIAKPLVRCAGGAHPVHPGR
jgi:tRNA(Ile2)-agmatinylcytidine synthase